MKYFGKFDFLGPEVDIEHGGETSTGSIFTLLISIICIVSITFSIVYFSQPLIRRKEPETDII